MTDANHNPPSEREWTIAEMEEFFASPDAITGATATNGTPGSWPTEPITLESVLATIDKLLKQPPIEFSTGWWNGPSIPLSSDDPFGDLYRLTHPGIHVTALVPPAQGWPLAMRCPICKVTTFKLDVFGIKPSDGDYFTLNGVCCDDEVGTLHNMQMATQNSINAILRFPIHAKSIYGYDPLEGMKGTK